MPLVVDADEDLLDLILDDLARGDIDDRREENADDRREGPLSLALGVGVLMRQ